MSSKSENFSLKESIKLMDIKGIGESVSQKLIQHFGSEIDALSILANRSILSLIKIEGVSERMAARLIRSYHSVLTGEEVDQKILQSNDIIYVFEKLLKLIQARGQTEYAKTKAIISLYPIAIKNKEKIMDRQIFFNNCLTLYQENFLQLDDIKKSLRSIKPLRSSSRTSIDIPDRIIVTTIPETLESFEKIGISKICQVKLIAELEYFPEIIEEHEEVLLFTEQESSSTESGNYIDVPENALRSPWVNFIPEKILSFYSRNINTLNKIIALNRIVKLPLEMKQLFPQLDRTNLNKDITIIEEYLSKLTLEGEIRTNIDSELNRVSYALDNFDRIVLSYQSKLNEQLVEKIESMQIQLEGKKILELLQSVNTEAAEGLNLRDYIDESIFELVETLSIQTETKIIKELNLLYEEQEIVEGLFPRDVNFPLEVNDDISDRLRHILQSKRRVREFIQKREIAKALEGFKDFLVELTEELFEIDYYLMIGQFANDFNLKLPSFIPHSKGLIFTLGKNIFLQEEFNEKKGKPSVIPVNYQVGNLGDSSERIILLSGANSGGKTTLLHLIAQILLLAQMGLGVPGKNVQLSGFNELYYYQKPVGTADAGAFETALSTFAKMVRSEQSKFILADEMEAISEPEASARVISAILDLLQGQDQSCGVFVSHLADQVSEKCALPIRIDGIEASGLDDNLELIVDRTPKINYHARSTPQLIVERLIRKSKNPQKKIYQEILNKF